MTRAQVEAQRVAEEQVLWWRAHGYSAVEACRALNVYPSQPPATWGYVQRSAARIWPDLAHREDCREAEIVRDS